MVGAGVVGRSPAFALAAAESSVRVMPAGDAGGATASDAAGAILGVLGEVTEHGARARHGRLRTELAVVAARMWPTWREQVRDRAGAGAPRRGGYGTGNFMILKAASSAWTTPRSRAWRTLRPSTGSAATIPPPADIPGYLPLDNDRALRARYLADEGSLDARVWLAMLDAALAALPNALRAQPGNATVLPAGGYLLDTPTGVFRARVRWWPPAPGPPRFAKPSTPTFPSCRSWPRPAPRRRWPARSRHRPR